MDTHNDIPQVRIESMRLLLKQVPIALVVNLINATLVAVVLARVQPLGSIAMWWGLVIALVSVRLFVWWRWARRDPLTPGQLELWRRRMLVGSTLSGLLWGGCAVILFPQQTIYQIFLAYVVGGMAAGAAAGLSYSLPVYFAFVLPSVLPLGTRLFLEASYISWVMGAMLIIFAVALSLFAVNQHRVLLGALRLQFEKAQLADELSDVLDNLEQRVESRTDELRESNRKLTSEIAERKRIEEAERRARAEADRANKAKSVFLASASHDLRQPIQGLRLYLGALGRALTTEQQRELLQKIFGTFASVEELLDTLMDLSALESGEVRPDVRSCNLQEVLGNIADEARVLAANAEVALRVHNCSRIVQVRTDPVLLGRMLRNLVTNAIGHAERGQVLLACRRRKDHVALEVWDSGPGIAEDQVRVIFNEFYQPQNPQRVLGQGLGLGLWIVARTAKLLQHQVGVRSRVGRGSVFSITVPIE